MNDEATSRCVRARDIFLETLERTAPDRRAAYLEEACAGDSTLRAAVDALLSHHKDDSFLETPVVQAPRAGVAKDGGAGLPNVAFERPGDRIGRYKLLQAIGEGGAGAVFMAEQEEPIRRRVALKVIKPGMDTKSVIARFETERQALAMMDHPNIAKVFDAGATQAGRPYFVMELVRGVRITDFCDQNHLTTRERLLLFIKVCQAIQHAHQKGIVHRDIKPSNIVVTLHDGVPVPKVIDFGIAKATDQRLTDKTLFTEFRSLIGTPAYMSPEQAEMSGLDIDTRTDIYSLGVLLYQLITGKTPFDARELLDSGLDVMRRTILEKEPLRPSTRVSALPNKEITTTAACRQVEPARLVSLIHGDLDWIVMRALEKDRARRYQTASDLAMDIQRHLDNEPVIARPPSLVYQLQKSMRRHKLVFAAAAAFMAALILGLALATWQYLEKSRAYERLLDAEHQQRRLRERAQEAHARELELRRQAEIQELTAWRKAYAADINLAEHALEVNNLGRALSLLDQQRPFRNRPDLRGWEWRLLWQKCRSDALFTLGRMSNEVQTLAVSHDGKWVASVEAGRGGLSVWDLRARQEIARFAHVVGKNSIAFSPVSPVLAWCETEWGPPSEFRSRVRLWDAAARQYAGDLPDVGRCQGLVFSSDGNTLMVAGDRGLMFWSVTEKKRLATQSLEPISPRGPSPRGQTMEVSKDFSWAACVLPGGRIRLLAIADGKERWTAQAAEEDIMALSFSPDGRMLASGPGFSESTIRLWDTATGRELARLEGHRTWISSLVFWPDGKTLASASADQTIRLWDLSGLPPIAARREGERRADPGRKEPASLRQFATLQGHQLEVWSLALMPDNTTLISGCKDGSICVWDTSAIQRNRNAIVLPAEVRTWSFAPDSQSILALDKEGRINRWQGIDFQSMETILETGERFVHAIFSPDGRHAVLAAPNGAAQIWDLPQHAMVQEIKVKGTPAYPLSFVPGTSRVILQHQRDGSCHEWDLASGKETRSWKSFAEPGFRQRVAYSPSGEWGVACNEEGMGVLHQLSTGREQRFDLNLKQIGQIGFSPDEKFFTAITRVGVGGVWATATADKIANLQGFLLGMASSAFSPDGKRLAIGSNAREAVKLWETEDYQELLTLEGQGSHFIVMAFSPDGNILGSSNYRGQLHLWRAPSVREIDEQEAPPR